jgi:putative oxidoreductase
MLRSLLVGGAQLDRAADAGVLTLRVFFGLSLAIAHGFGKFPPSDRFVAGVAEMGFPLPGLFAWASTGAELGCALLIAAGLLTRPAAAMVAVNMCVATFIRQAGDPFTERELAAAYLAACVAILLIGSGRHGVDAVLRRHGTSSVSGDADLSIREGALEHAAP